MTYVDVAVTKAHTGDKLFTYVSDSSIGIGVVVSVPFGKKTVFGVVINIVKKPTFPVKEILAVGEYCLPEQYVGLMKWMFEYYPDDYGVITQLFLPNTISFKTKPHVLEAQNGNGLALQSPTGEQLTVLQEIARSESLKILLHGDTGTGKTRVFLESAKETLELGKSVLILTPEIGLTPQLLQDVVRHLTGPILLTHSQLKDKERRAIWQYALSNRGPTVYIGPRSALFIPISNLGLIVIDESHDSSYKQGQSPRYNSLYVASKLADLYGAKLIQSSATPNVDDYTYAKKLGYLCLRIKQKASGSFKSHIQLIDMKNKNNFTKSQFLSNPLINQIEIALKNSQQAMLFLNRRGSARIIICSDCGWRSSCPNCNLPLVFHHDTHTARCHTCGYKTTAPSTCPVCDSINIAYYSPGTKSLLEHTQSLFPQARIARFDADSSSPDKYYLNIEAIKDNEIDIIIGTQLITKGIDLPNLRVVGIINADLGLNLPDYRAEETCFQQLYQVTGRADRGRFETHSYLQTRETANPVIQTVVDKSWEDFYDYEIANRKLYGYPPYRFLALFKIYKATSRSAEFRCLEATDTLKNLPGLTILGPSPSFYEKSTRGYAWQIIIKSHKRSLILDAARKMGSEWVVDMDPISLL
jgi:primosomal protein N' (replication factor Y) (superfamily II helicase)